MSREICRMNIVMTDEGERTIADVDGYFEGGGAEVVNLVRHILSVLDLSPMQGIGVCRMVEESLRREEEQ